MMIRALQLITLYLVVAWLAEQAVLGQIAVNPQNLFDAGLNLGYVRQHGDAGTDPENLATFAANFAAEWLVSVNPEPPAIEIPLKSPVQFYPGLDTISSVRSYLASMPYCIEPYYTSRIATCDAGFYLGLAIASTANQNTAGVKSALGAGGLFQSLSILGRNTKNQAILDMAKATLELGANFQSGSTLQETKERHLQIFAQLNQIRNRLNEELPDADIGCGGDVESGPEFLFRYRSFLTGPSLKNNGVEPTRVEVRLDGGILEAAVKVRTGRDSTCDSRVRYEWRFLEPIRYLGPRDEIDVQLSARLLTAPCRNSRFEGRFSGSNNGSLQMRTAGMRPGADILADQPKPLRVTADQAMTTATIKVVYVTSDQCYFKVDFSSVASVGSEKFNYEVVYVYDKVSTSSVMNDRVENSFALEGEE